MLQWNVLLVILFYQRDLGLDKRRVCGNGVKDYAAHLFFLQHINVVKKDNGGMKMNFRNFTGLPSLLVGAAILTGTLVVQGILGAFGALLSFVVSILSMLRFIGMVILVFGLIRMTFAALRRNSRKGFW
jgi:hypothetical protein